MVLFTLIIKQDNQILYIIAKYYILHDLNLHTRVASLQLMFNVNV